MDTIVIITYKSGTREARFSTDPELLELIIDGFDYISEIEQVHFTGIIPTPEPQPQPLLTDDRLVRESIRRLGKAATRNLME